MYIYMYIYVYIYMYIYSSFLLVSDGLSPIKKNESGDAIINIFFGLIYKAAYIKKWSLGG